MGFYIPEDGILPVIRTCIRAAVRQRTDYLSCPVNDLEELDVCVCSSFGRTVSAAANEPLDTGSVLSYHQTQKEGLGSEMSVIMKCIT
jgi:hypothetical protein